MSIAELIGKPEFTESEQGEKLMREKHREWDSLLQHRNAFARSLYSEMLADETEILLYHGGKDRITYKTAAHRLLGALTGSGRDDLVKLFHEMDEKALAYASESYMDGIAFGHVVEEFRQGLLKMYPVEGEN